MVITRVNKNQVEAALSHLILDEGRNSVYAGFTHLGPNTATSQTTYDADFLVAREEEKVIGVLKLSESVRLNNPNVKSISYIDIHKEHWQQGIAKALCLVADSCYPRDTIFVATAEDGMGYKIGIAKRLEKYFKRCAYYPSAETYLEHNKSSTLDL